MQRTEHRYLVFIDLNKAFDTVPHEGLWKILGQVGCPDKVIDRMHSFNDGMPAHILEHSEPFTISNGTKHGCVLVPALFGIVSAAMLCIAFMDCNCGIYIQALVRPGQLWKHGRRCVHLVHFPVLLEGPLSGHPPGRYLSHSISSRCRSTCSNPPGGNTLFSLSMVDNVL